MQPDPIYAPDSMYHRQRRWTNPHTVRCLETAMTVLGMPASLLDVGCAEGVLVEWALEHQIEAMGVDLAAPADFPALVRADIRGDLDLGRTFQWVLCWEVAEHLPASAADGLCQMLVRHLDMAPNARLIFTAARVGQRGPGHVNCQEPGYWLEKFSALGLMCASAVTASLSRSWLRCAPQAPWYGRNVQVLWRRM